MQTELDHQESWTLTIRRNGDNWPDVRQSSRRNPVFVHTITCEIQRGALDQHVSATGWARRKDGSVSQQRAHIIFADEHDWIRRLVEAERMKHGLHQAATDVPL